MKRIGLFVCVWLAGAFSCYLDPEVQCTWEQDCLQGMLCKAKRCLCPEKTELCGKECVELSSNRFHCGACGNLCVGQQVCSAGTCRESCKDPQKTVCRGACVDLQSDERHCGQCDNACQGGRTCRQGSCACGAGEVLCSGKCVNTQTNPNHCGTCDKACPKGQSCIAGSCGANCESTGRKLCGQECVDLKTDARHCGQCNKACQSGEECCAGSCVNTQESTAHCGKCDNPCAKGQPCEKGFCRCASGQTNCSGACVDLQSDKKHCGQCDNPCNGTCTAGNCCPTGESWCGRCADLQRDPAHCGQCDKNCKGEACIAGQCAPCQKDSDCLAPLTCSAGKCLCGSGCDWAKVFGAQNARLEAAAVAVDAQQTSYLVGSFQGKVALGGVALESTKGSEDLFVAALDAGGRVVWARAVGGEGQERGVALTLDPAEKKLFVGGTFTSASLRLGQKTLTNKDKAGKTRDLFVFSIDLSKATSTDPFLWASSAGSASEDDVGGIAARSKGDLALVGTFRDQASFGSLTLPAPPKGVPALFVAGLQADGAFAWVQTTNVDSAGRAIATDAQGAVYVTGLLGDDLTLAGQTITSTGSDLFVAKLNSSGDFLWIAATQGPATGYAIATNAAAEVYLAGELGPGAVLFGTKTATAQGNLDAFVAKVDKQGAFAWVKAAPVTAGKLSRATSLHFQAPDSLAVAGYFFDKITLNKPHTAQDNKDAFVARLRDKTTEGTWDWSTSAGSKMAQQAQSIALDRQGSAYLTGWFEDSIKFFIPGQSNPQQKNARGSRDLFLWKITPP